MEEIKLDTEQNESGHTNKGILIGVIGGAILLAVVFAIVFGIYGGDGLSSSSYLSYENYIEIENGMSYSQVVDILDGHEGVLDTSSSYGGYTLSYYTWSNSSGTRCIVVGFENNKVCAKSQYGLD